MKAHDVFDLLLIFVIIVVGTASTIASLARIDAKIEDYTMGDKATIEASNDNTPPDFEYTPQDVLLMYIVADQYQPYPSKMQLNTGVITTFSPVYFTDSNTAINNLWNSEVNALMTKNITTFNVIYDSDGGNVRWQVITD